jgi:hypothetical protein
MYYGSDEFTIQCMHSLNDKVKFIERLLGKVIVGKNDISAWCPICKSTNSEKRKLSIRIQDDLCHCWRCGFKSYSLLPLIKKFGNQQQFVEYSEKFLVKRKRDDDNVEVEQSVSLPVDFKPLFDERTLLDPDACACMSYMRGRGLSEKDAFLWKFGVSNELCWKRRVIIPSFDADGMLNYYVGRTIDNVFPKYNNVQMNKNNIVFNEIAIDWKKPLAIVEGPFDLVKCRFNATCLLGNQLSENSLLFNSILENSTPVVIMLDSDLPGKIHHLALLLAHYNINVSVTDFGEFKDPGDMSFDVAREKFETARPWTKDDYVSYKISCVTNARKLL